MAASYLPLCVCLALAIGLQYVHADCPDEWVTYQDACYTFVTNNTNWHGASAYCQSHQSELVAIETTDENEFLLRHVKQFGCSFRSDFWMDATDMITDGVWIWAANQAPLTYFNWDKKEPNGQANEDCVTVKREDGLWYDLSCSDHRYFICEKKKTPCTAAGGGSPDPIIG